ncbi:DNA primase [Gordonia phage Strosahl]|uniref:DNA primase n=3 Tax=Soupsvirus TaxID=1982562 RepID=A0A160DGI1_9CAUD|nr:DNA primase [Gordonia phage Rosalind]YP_009269087.1 DNA primase [Gordonia phage KatherineG]YP_009281678.1 DNA primase [Gordonia phage Remus]YP_009286007.1 DNA primase [Gordonia phage JSwag]YP_009596268.1 DNA primase [Gordonia phage Strosahl]QFP95131.1 DNA primase [Gordonia phage MinecraftSteve]QZD98714.1 DNA primase [Gordonia phage Looper]UAJ15591.1 DNA primase [Gordonia Phage Boohoo]UVD39813.1 DNA primase [Gordonia phage Anaysia]WIC40196.1 DNA primase [Gordonia phage Battleship]
MSIKQAILRYYPDWEPPEDQHEWNKTCCPFHGDENPSAAVSYDNDAFNCMACGVKGDVISIIRHEEKEVSFAEAKRIAAELSVGGNNPVPARSAGKPGRRVFGQSGDRRQSSAVRPGVRRRPTPWS